MTKNDAIHAAGLIGGILIGSMVLRAFGIGGILRYLGIIAFAVAGGFIVDRLVLKQK